MYVPVSVPTYAISISTPLVVGPSIVIRPLMTRATGQSLKTGLSCALQPRSVSLLPLEHPARFRFLALACLASSLYMSFKLWISSEDK